MTGFRDEGRGVHSPPSRARAAIPDLAWFRQNVPCLAACPVQTDAGGYVQLIAAGCDADAYRVARAPNPLASVCGRTCAAPCEDVCRRGRIDEPVTIRALKRFATERCGPESLVPPPFEDLFPRGVAPGSSNPGDVPSLLARRDPANAARRVAVVGAGPAGLACAHDLALLGYRVAVFEAQDRPGGMMRYGIPEYRLPREVIEREVAVIESLGVEFRYRTPLTADFGLGALHEQGYEAIFLAVGAGRARGLRIPGVELDGVILAIDFLLNVNRGYRVGIGRRVVVVGGGLVALDAARTAIRTAAGRVGEEEVGGTALRVALDAAREAMRRGALEVTVASLESLTEMPAMKSVQGREEVATCEAEGVRFLPAWGPRAIHGRAGRAAAIELIRCVRVFDETGRFSPAFDEATTQTVPADTVLLAIGQAPDISFLRPEDGVETGPGGMIRVDPETLATTARGVFAGGDGAFPPAIIVTVAAHGKRAARSIDAYLHGEGPPTRLRARVEALPIDTYRMPPGYERQPRFVPSLPIARRTGIAEVELCYSEADARAQAARCLACHVHPIYDGDRCVLCGRCADVCPEDCIRFLPLDRVELPPLQRDALAPRLGGAADGFTALLYDGARCIRCGLCALRCPTGAITMERFRFEES